MESVQFVDCNYGDCRILELKVGYGIRALVMSV